MKQTKNSPKGPQDQSFKRLDFLFDFAAAANLSFDDIAKISSVARPTIYHWIRSQDTKLSNVDAIARSRDYELIVSLEDREPSASVQELSLNNLTLLPDGNFKLKRMAFLEVLMERKGINKGKLAAIIGVSPVSVRTWFKRQDISISRIYEIAELLDCSIKFKFVPLKTKNSSIPKGARTVTTEIIVNKTKELK